MAPRGSSAKAITNGPAFHWFGYYDKLQFDVTGRYVLGMEVNFEHRSPRPDDVIRLGMVDRRDGNRWVELGTSRAWCWQQGCMLQWRPGFDSEVLWNDRDGDQFVCRIMDVRTRTTRTLPGPVYTVSADGMTALAPDFRRINDTRPGYGYCGPADPYAAQDRPEASGIYRMDLGTGKRDLIISIADVVKIPCATLSMENRKHYFNHLLFNPDGSRFVFLHRSIDRNGQRGFNTRAITADPDGRNRYVVNDSGMWSHFIWRDPQHLLSWSRNSARGDAMYLNQDRTDSLAVVANGAIAHDSHVSYLPDGQWLVCDGYPRGANREQPLFLCHAETGEKVDLGAYPSPQPYQGEWRCDLHPRFSRDGRTLCIDSAHEGKGRQLYLIDLN